MTVFAGKRGPLEKFIVHFMIKKIKRMRFLFSAGRCRYRRKKGQNKADEDKGANRFLLHLNSMVKGVSQFKRTANIVIKNIVLVKFKTAG